YTDPRLLDVAGAVEALPSLPLGNAKPVQATGTAGGPTDEPRSDSDSPASHLALHLALPPWKPGQPAASACNGTRIADETSSAVSDCPVNRKDSLTSAVNESLSGAGGVRTRDLLNAIQRGCAQNRRKFFRPLGLWHSILSKDSVNPYRFSLR